MRKIINIILLIAGILPIVLLLYPFAMWNDTMLLMLRIIPSFAIQILLCRIGKYKIIKGIPLLLTGALAVWGTYLFHTSPYWINATFWGSLMADYVSPFICCTVAFIVCLLVEKNENRPN